MALVCAVMAVVGLHGDRGLVLIALAMGCKLAGDVLLTRAEAQDAYVVGGPVDLTWLAAAVLTGAAAVLAGRPPGATRGTPAGTRTGWRVLAVPLACKVASLVVLRMEWGDATVSVGEVCALGCLAAAFLRTAVTFAEVRALHDVRREASTDELTDLPDRRALLHQDAEEVRKGRPVALLLLDLDGFKAVNDGLGHRAGDDLLRMLGGRIRPALRPRDVLARLGGDEFAVLLPDTTAVEAMDCAVRVHELICLPVTVEGVPLRIGASLGLATAPDQARTVADLLHHADRAMYAAKAARGGVRRYDPDLDRSGRRGRVAVRPGTGDDAGELLFRPLTDAVDGRVVAGEALIARSAERGLEAADLTVLPEVLAAVSGWWAAAQVPARITLPPADLGQPRLADRVSAALLRSGLPPGALVCRLPHDPGPAVVDVPGLLAALRTRGVRTAVDGFGPGVLALGRLRDLPVDEIHLDPGLARDVGTDPRAALVVQHTVALAGALGSTVVAEDGDTTPDLVRVGCLVLRRPDSAPILSAGRFGPWLQQTGTTATDPVGR